MAEFLGIRNENEFYFAHYLSSLMDDELKEQCQNETLGAARDKLLKLANDYYEVRHLRERVEQRKGTFAADAKAYLDARKAFTEKLIGILGYAGDYRPNGIAFQGEKVALPVLGCVLNAARVPQVVLIDSCRTFSAGVSLKDVSVLQNFPTAAQVACEGLSPADREYLSTRVRGDRSKNQMPYWENLLTNELFSSANHPRFAIVFGENAVLLADYTKWAERRSLVFLLDDIFEQTDRATCRAMACLLHRNSLAPDSGSEPLPDKLDANSHKNAFGVSKSLRYAMRQAIEDLGNAILRGSGNGEPGSVSAASLSKECILVMYRFLFVLFLESRKDLQYFKRSAGNVANDIFWSAYGLDHLRDLETVPLLTEAAKNGHYFDETIKQLFAKIWEGYDCYETTNFHRFPQMDSEKICGNLRQSAVQEASHVLRNGIDGFRLLPLKAHLFDPERTPLFNEARIPNHVWQKIIYSLSIGETGTGKRKRKGRISYAQLGIQQLGAVYEALLSYTGFYAKEDLYEVAAADATEPVVTGDDGQDSDAPAEETGSPAEKKASGKSGDIFETGYFVTEAELKDYTEAEIVAVDGRRVCHRRGSFIYRMAGRDRERSASYYTPEVLTRCLVRLAIKECVTDDMPADEVMKLTVCEPAMGSAAFLNETIDQLADAYLRKKQKELGRTIPIERYAAEKARVKMVIADNNVFGVDLNPTAADLAEVSLWLGSIGGEMEPTGQERDEPYIPWFGTQLKCGNSIIGCRREVVFRDGTRKRIGFDEEFPENAVWHFLIPDDGMAIKLDKVVKGIVGDEVATRLRTWAKAFSLPDKKKAGSEYANTWNRLVTLSKAIDRIWRSAADDIKALDDRTRDDVAYFGYEPKPGAYQDIKSKDRQLNTELSRDEYGNVDYSKSLGSVSDYFRLKTILDLWCSLWFWPLDKTEELPAWKDFEAIVRVLAKSDFDDEEQLELDFGIDFRKTVEGVALEKEFRRNPTLSNLYKLFPFAKTSQQIAERHHFLHWELEFAPVFKERGGFDLIIGNPPWVKVQWEEAGILSEYDPHIAIRSFSASDTMALRKGVFKNHASALQAYLQEFTDTVGTKSFLNAENNYPALHGVQTNLYKNFIALSFRLLSKNGNAGLIHPKDVFDDPRGGLFREAIYPRLLLHARFQNELKLFDIEHGRTYSLNVYGKIKPEVSFLSVARLFHPSTLEESLKSTEMSPLPLERTDKGKWNTQGHPDRVVPVTDESLRLFASLYDEPGTPLRAARLPALYTSQFLNPILSSFVNALRKMQDMEYGVSECWHETMARKDGTIKRQTGFVDAADEVIYSGPQFFLGNPINKTPKIQCLKNLDYDNVDLTAISSDYHPRVNYIRNVRQGEYRLRIPDYNGRKITEYFRVFCRHMIDTTGTERSFLSIFAPKGWAHVNSVIELTLDDRVDMSELTSTFGAWLSLPFDWIVRSTGKANLHNDTLKRLPAIGKNPFVSSRALLLNCLNRDYAELWREAWDDACLADGWLSSEPCLTDWKGHLASGNEWRWETPLRTQLDRRQALVELDVIVTKALGLSLDDLLLMYRVSFPVLRKYDADTFYDQNGRCVFSAKSGESYLSRKEWEAIRDMKEGEFSKTITETVFSDTPTERTIIYKAPFFKKDREADYKEAWEMLEKRG